MRLRFLFKIRNEDKNLDGINKNEFDLGKRGQMGVQNLPPLPSHIFLEGF